ncbi:hypothetical protein ACET6T_07635 [Aeromonas veronii]
MNSTQLLGVNPSSNNYEFAKFMAKHYISFLIAPDGKVPQNLKNSIRQVVNSSAGFRQSWLKAEKAEAYETSQEAFQHLDYIQNELLRQRDALKQNSDTWQTSTFVSKLSVPVGNIINNATSSDYSWFLSLPQDEGTLPIGRDITQLTLEKALNKLKHRDTAALRFLLPSEEGHFIYIYTKAGMGQPDTISEINISLFCDACKAAAECI